MSCAAALAGLGAAALVAGLLQSPERAWLNLLLISYYLVSLGLGALVFVAIQYVTGAGWSVALRRVPEAMAAILPVAVLGLGVVFLVRPSLYPWAGDAAGESGPVIPLRHFWFNRPFFLARAAFYLACWIALGFALVSTSRRQDRDGDPARTRHERPPCRRLPRRLRRDLLAGQPGLAHVAGRGVVQHHLRGVPVRRPLPRRPGGHHAPGGRPLLAGPISQCPAEAPRPRPRETPVRLQQLLGLSLVLQSC